MYIKQDIELRNFQFWGGAAGVAGRMTLQEIDSIEEWLEDSAPEKDYAWDEVSINDFFWFQIDDEDLYEILLCGTTSEEFYKRPILRTYHPF